MFIVLQGLHPFNKSNGENPLQLAGKALKDSSISWLDERNLLKSSRVSEFSETSALLGVFNLWILILYSVTSNWIPSMMPLTARVSMTASTSRKWGGFYYSSMACTLCCCEMLPLFLLLCTMSFPYKYLPFGVGGPCSTFQGDVHCQLFSTSLWR